MRVLTIALAVLLTISLVGCGGGPEPRLRLGCYPTSTVGVHFPDPANLGSHSYAGSDNGGIVYTCRGGDIDLNHLRIAADWTMYYTHLTYDSLMENKTEFSFKSKPARSRYYVTIQYPSGWAEMPKEDKERIAREVSLGLGPYFGYAASTWHEIITWFGYKFVAMFPEFASAFSWEDSYSNLLGTRLAVEAMQDKRGYDEAMTDLLAQELSKLGVQSPETAKLASEKVRGEWFSGKVVYMVKMKKRNFDIGIDDGYVTPTLLPGVSECRDAQAQSYPAPTLAVARKYGLGVKLEISPKIWESGKILKVAYGEGNERGERIEPEVHFPRIMSYIREDAIKRYGPDVSD